MSKNNRNIDDDEIRIIKSINETESEDKSNMVYSKSSEKKLWLKVVIASFIIMLFALNIYLFFFAKSSSDVSATDVLNSKIQNKGIVSTGTVTPVDENVNRQYSYAYTQEERDTVAGIPLLITIPLNSKPTLALGKDVLNDKDVVCMAQAASVSLGKDGSTKIVGAFVMKGEPISWGKSKAGYCAIINDSIFIGSSDNTSLFEKATENEGYFFRQFSIIENGEVSRFKNRDLCIRRALCLHNGMIKIITSENKVMINDFSEAIAQYGVNEALLLDGDQALQRYTDKDGKIHNIGKVLFSDMSQVSFIVWK